MILLPETEAEAVGLIRDAADKGTRLALGGNGTRAGFGNVFLADATLRSTKLSGIVDYDPAEMVMSAQAGTPLAAIEAALAQNRQMLAFEPMDHRPVMGTKGEPTIGGVFAANETHWSVVMPNTTAVSMSSRRRRSFRSVPIKAALTLLPTTASSPCGPKPGRNALPG
jgi:FAD/FMN-containing dehydrogenase